MCCNQGCSVDEVTRAFSGCTPGRTRITLTGHYLYSGLNITVGGVLATVDVALRVTSATFILPLSNFDPTKRYDMTVTTVAGSFTWPGAFSFVGTPVIAWVDPCVDTGYVSFNGPILMKCFAGERITMHVANFNYSTLTAVNLTLTRGWLGPDPLQCTDVQPSATDEQLATCVVPERWTSWWLMATDTSMTAHFNSSPPTQSNILNYLGCTTFPCPHAPRPWSDAPLPCPPPRSSSRSAWVARSSL